MDGHLLELSKRISKRIRYEDQFTEFTTKCLHLTELETKVALSSFYESIQDATFTALRRWCKKQTSRKEAFQKLVQSLKQYGMHSMFTQNHNYLQTSDLAEELQKWCDTRNSDQSKYRSGTVNSNTVNSKFHLIRSYCEIFFYNFPNISCLKCTVDSNFHLIRSKTLPMNDFELTVPNL